mmetsp:Transcript_930/g.1189  ORF Transcript_930/g.1189 Transcript_930/m.1189 type:complete len:353 (+) Transcript_930:2-1060(+)
MNNSILPDKPSNSNKTCVGPTSEKAGKADTCKGCPNQSACASGATKLPDPSLKKIRARFETIGHTILVLSGKGGVGKSTVACQLAFTLASQGFQVGLLDVDICGPSVPQMLGLSGQEVHQSSSGWSPVYVRDNLGVMSIGFMLPGSDDAVIWRGPRKNGLIKQFFTDVDWEKLDYLIVDTPPGTSDEHISTVQFLKDCDIDGALVVTTPQEISMADVRKEINFCKKTEIKVLGVVGNMDQLKIPFQSLLFSNGKGENITAQTMHEISEKLPDLLDAVVSANVFNGTVERGPEKMAELMEVPFIGYIPLDPNLLKACENGRPFVEEYPKSAATEPFLSIVDRLKKAVEEKTME